MARKIFTTWISTGGRCRNGIAAPALGAGGSSSGAGSSNSAVSGSSSSMGVSLSASGGYSSGASGHSNFSELKPTASELSRNRREVEEENAEEEAAFEAMQAYLHANTEEEAPAPSYDAVVLTAQAEEALRAAQQQLDQAVLAASLSTAQAEAVTRRAAKAEAIAREQRRAATLHATAAVELEGMGQDVVILSSSDDEDDNNDGTIVISGDEDK